MVKAHPKDCKCKTCKEIIAGKLRDKQINGMADPETLSQKDKQRNGLKDVKESVAITGFIKCINEKNFAQANKYLQVATREKIKAKISQCANLKPF